MARHTRAHPTVSLFPFLSILVCMMGVLAFLMVSLAVVSAARPAVRIELEGTHTKRPIFVECRKDHLVLHPERQQVSLSTMDEEDSPFMRLLDRVRQHRNQEYILFTIYPDGIECFYKGRVLVERKNKALGFHEDEGIDLGFEPLLQDWQLHLEQAERS